MNDLPKLAKDPTLLAPKKNKIVGPLAKALLLGGSALAGLGIMQGTPTNTVTPAVPPAISMSATPTAQSITPAPLVLQPASVNMLLAGHTSHASHASHRSHSSHHSGSF